MAELIQIAVERVDQTGSVVKRTLVGYKEIKEPQDIIDLGLRHSEQIDIIKELQDEVISAQVEILNQTINYCQKCGNKLTKRGYTKSDFNGVFTDHKVSCSRKVCGKCQWKSIPSVRSIFGTQIHPDLAKLQVELSGKHPYRSAQKILNAMVNKKRRANNHSGLKTLTELVGHFVDKNPIEEIDNVPPSDELIVQVDGGHLKTIEDQRSVEALTSVVYNPKNVAIIGGNEKIDGTTSEIRGLITSKSCGASALSDNQKSIKIQTLRAAKQQGLTKKTKVTALCDGASNCWTVIDSLKSESASVDCILDWFHIAMKFKNTGLGNSELNKKLESAKWHLWHGNADKCLDKLSSLAEELIEDVKKLNKVEKLKGYIENNKHFVTHYEKRKNSHLIFTSHLAEATVESLINQRCKNKQHMRWSREGLHSILVIRAVINSDQWEEKWDRHISGALKNAA
jgi:hypothetical protein